ncbi:9845_t:CDS:2, partial [Entrophospora sp. SA101]
AKKQEILEETNQLRNKDIQQKDETNNQQLKNDAINLKNQLAFLEKEKDNHPKSETSKIEITKKAQMSARLNNS